MTGRETITVPSWAALETSDETDVSSAAEPGDLNQQLIDTSIWTDELGSQAGIPIVDAPLVTVGGGIGSFVLTDHLRVAGMPTSAIRSLGTIRVPWETYE